MFELTSYVGLFLAAFGAATLLPMQSEAVLVGMLLSDQYVASALLAVATLGNVLGSALNWILGRSIERLRHKRWSLLLSWVPIIGDPLTVVAGVMREPLWSFLLIVSLAKGVCYLVLAAVTLGWA
ncbi:YqaA family protein [Pseudomonas sp. HLT2-19-2]